MLNWAIRSKTWIALFTLAMALRLLSLVPAIIDEDEAFFSVSAASLSAPSLFFQETLDNKPPGTVWFYWLIGKILASYPTPQLARAVGVVLALATALVIGSIAGDSSERLTSGDRRHDHVARTASLLSLLCWPLASVKLLALTNEGLLMFLTSSSLLLALQRSVPGAIAAGVLLGSGFLVKQTAVFFIGPIAFALWGSPLLIVLTIFATTATAGAGVFALGADNFWYWTFVYPKQILHSARSGMFDAWKSLLINSLVFLTALLPVVSLRHKVSKIPAFVWAWLLAGIAAVLLGRGIFLHYFLLLIAPLVTLASLTTEGNIWSNRWRRAWLWGGYAVSSLLIAVPGIPAFWGMDLFYYQRAADVIRGNTKPEDRVLAWGGSAAPVALARRRHVAPYVTARFATNPYGTKKSSLALEAELTENPPALIMDLHERGDNRFNTQMTLWMSWSFAKTYNQYVDPGLPWARFYLPQNNLAHQMVQVQREFQFERVPVGFEAGHLKLEKTFPNIGFFSTLSRAFMALEDFCRALPNKCTTPETVQLSSDITAGVLGFQEHAENNSLTLKQQVDLTYRKQGLRPHLALESPLWWISYSIVRLQPIPGKRSAL